MLCHCQIFCKKQAAVNNLRKYNESLIYSTKALAIDPNNADALSSKGMALYNIGNYTGAIEYYNKALAINPENEAALANKAAALEQHQKQFCSRSYFCSET